MPPSVGKALPEARCRGEETGDEDGAAAAEEVVERRGQPAADERAAEVGRGVDETGEPGGAFGLVANAELRGVEELGAVDDGFV